jgi:superfamily I DNA/RNA helicase
VALLSKDFSALIFRCLLPSCRLALNPDDDPSFERVLNVPARRLGAKLLQQLREEQEQLLAASNDILMEQQQQDSAEQQQQQPHSLYHIAWRLLRNGDIATLHAGKLRGFLETLQVCKPLFRLSKCIVLGVNKCGSSCCSHCLALAEASIQLCCC